MFVARLQLHADPVVNFAEAVGGPGSLVGDQCKTIDELLARRPVRAQNFKGRSR